MGSGGARDHLRCNGCAPLDQRETRRGGPGRLGCFVSGSGVGWIARSSGLARVPWIR